MQPEHVGKATRRHAVRSSRSCVEVTGPCADGLHSPHRIVHSGDADIDRRLAVRERRRRDACVLERLPGHLEQQSLLGIKRDRLTRAHAEERGIEMLDVTEEAAPARVDLPLGIGVGIKDLVNVPAALRHLGDGVPSLPEEFPERPGIVDPSREAAADADNRDRLFTRAPGRGELLLQFLDGPERTPKQQGIVGARYLVH